jgi:hypothetical protein
MFSDKFERTLNKYPGLGDRLRRIATLLQRQGPGNLVDPAVVAAQAEMDVAEVVALFEALSEQSAGDFT